MSLVEKLKEIFNIRTNLLTEPIEHWIYAGPEEHQDGESFEFWVVVRPEDGEPQEIEVMLPCTAKDPEVVEELKNMKPGQSFEILEEEEGYDPIGTMVTKIKTGPEYPVFELTGKEPYSLSQSQSPHL